MKQRISRAITRLCTFTAGMSSVGRRPPEFFTAGMSNVGRKREWCCAIKQWEDQFLILPCCRFTVRTKHWFNLYQRVSPGNLPREFCPANFSPGFVRQITPPGFARQTPPVKQTSFTQLGVNGSNITWNKKKKPCTQTSSTQLSVNGSYIHIYIYIYIYTYTYINILFSSSHLETPRAHPISSPPQSQPTA